MSALKGETMEPVSTSALEVFTPWVPGTLSLAVYVFVVAGLLAAILALTSRLGVKKPGLEKLRPYESGIIPTGTAPFPYPVAFYLMATYFLIFDVEAVYIFSWAIALEGLGWMGWLQISFFITVLIVSLFYLWKKGGLEWGSNTWRK